MKLTNQHRTDIISRCIAARFNMAEQAYDAARTALADAVYDHAFGEGEKQAKKLPAGWCSSMNHVHITCDGFRSRYYSDDDCQKNVLKLSRERLQPAIIRNEFNITNTHPLYKQAQEVVQIFKSIKDGKKKLEEQLRTLLYSVTTREKLLEVWPEGEPYFPAVVQKSAAPVPYELTLQINRMMGIGEVVA